MPFFFLRRATALPLNPRLDLAQNPQKEKGAARRARQAADADALRAGLTPAPVRPQRTIESAREADPTTPAPGDEDAAAAAAHDEFSAYFSGDRPPRLMLTTTSSPKARTFALIADLLEVLPAATYYRRGGHALARVADAAAKKDFTHLLVLNEGPSGVDSLLVAHLPAGPTAWFRMTSIRLARSIPGHGRAVAGTAPELVLAGFGTRLGSRVGRLLASMFPPVPAFRARQVATFHAQRDFIFFRHHRYIFEQKKKGKGGGGAAGANAPSAQDPPHAQGVTARLQELGPRFTLRLSALYKGLLAGPGAETEWVATRAAKGAGANRRRFVL
jgi:ribosome production factor 1